MSKIDRLIEGAYGILEPMKGVRGGNKARGFTIVETLVVVAITGVLFAAIVITLNGRQQRTEFAQSIQEIQSQIQQVISDTSVGYYPNTQNFTCSSSITGPVFSTASATAQGANTGCVFLGRAIQFQDSSSTGGIYKFNIFTIAGLQRQANGDEVTTYAQAIPKPVAPPAATVDATEGKKLLYGLRLGKMSYGAGTQVGTIAFVNTLASYSSGAIVSGSQDVQVVPVRNSQLNWSKSNAASNIQSQLAGSDFNPSTGVTLCFISGGTNQMGIIKVGGSGRQLAVNLEIRGGTTCP